MDEESSLEITSSPLVPSICYSTVCEPFFGSFSLIIVCSYLSRIQTGLKSVTYSRESLYCSKVKES